MASSIVFINIKGEVLIYRTYKYDVSRQETMEFCRKIISTKESKEMPIRYMNGVSYIFTQEGEIVLLATTKCNVNAGLMFEFLYAFIKICKNYFGEFTEEKIRNNFVLIYELLDECMDYGYPQLKKIYIHGRAKSGAINKNAIDEYFDSINRKCQLASTRDLLSRK